MSTYATPSDLAIHYNISAATVRRYVNEGHWPADRIGQGQRKLIRFSAEQQEHIQGIVAGQKAENIDHDRINAALLKLSA